MRFRSEHRSCGCLQRRSLVWKSYTPEDGRSRVLWLSLDDGVSCDGTAGVPTNSDRAEWRADFNQGFLEGKVRLTGAMPAMAVAELPDDGISADVILTLQVVRQFAGGASIEHIAAELNVTDTHLEVSLRDAVSAVLRFLSERPSISSAPAHTPFEAQLVSLARLSVRWRIVRHHREGSVEAGRAIMKGGAVQRVRVRPQRSSRLRPWMPCFQLVCK
jgi:hypothetical protein